VVSKVAGSRWTLTLCIRGRDNRGYDKGYLGPTPAIFVDEWVRAHETIETKQLPRRAGKPVMPARSSQLRLFDCSAAWNWMVEVFYFGCVRLFSRSRGLKTQSGCMSTECAISISFGYGKIVRNGCYVAKAWRNKREEVSVLRNSVVGHAGDACRLLRTGLGRGVMWEQGECLCLNLPLKTTAPWQRALDCLSL